MPNCHSSQEPSRVLPTSGIHNFRDYGGYSVIGGGRLIRGLLYRSGDHAKATESDLDLVAGLQLAAVIDLRGTGERAEAPCHRPAGFKAKVIFADGETAAPGAPHIDAATQAIDGADARRTMQDRYRNLPFRPLLVSIFREYFRTLAETEGSTVVYCSAGKDRTGVLVALLHSALGVHRDDIFDDYLLTNSAGDNHARIASLKDFLEAQFGRGLTDESLHIISSVEPSFLDSALDEIIERHGSIDSYLSDVLHVTPQLRAALATHLIV